MTETSDFGGGFVSTVGAECESDGHWLGGLEAGAYVVSIVPSLRALPARTAEQAVPKQDLLSLQSAMNGANQTISSRSNRADETGSG